MKVPRISSVELVETKHGFFLGPFYDENSSRELKLVKVKTRRGGLLSRLFGKSVVCWAIEHWIVAQDGARELDFTVLLDPNSTDEDVEKEKKRAEEFYCEDWEKLAACVRSDYPAIQRYPEQPALASGVPPSPEELQRVRYRHKRTEEYEARIKVLKERWPQTAHLVLRSAKSATQEEKRQLQAEAVQAYFAEEVCKLSTDEVVEAWQKSNPLTQRWLGRISFLMKKKLPLIDPVAYELAFNWLFNKYDQLTEDELAEEVYRHTEVRLTGAAIKKRRERLGLTTDRSPGPRPKV